MSRFRRDDPWHQFMCKLLKKVFEGDEGILNGVKFPQTAKAVSHLVFIAAMRLSIRLWEILLHSLSSAISKTGIIKRTISITVIHCHPRISHTCFMRFKSRKHDDHIICCFLHFPQVKLYKLHI